MLLSCQVLLQSSGLVNKLTVCKKLGHDSFFVQFQKLFLPTLNYISHNLLFISHEAFASLHTSRHSPKNKDIFWFSLPPSYPYTLQKKSQHLDSVDRNYISYIICWDLGYRPLQSWRTWKTEVRIKRLTIEKTNDWREGKIFIREWRKCCISWSAWKSRCDVSQWTPLSFERQRES